MLAVDCGDLHDVCGHVLHTVHGPFYRAPATFPYKVDAFGFLASEPWNLNVT